MSDISTLEKKIGLKFNDIKLIQKAFIHRSYLNENRKFSSSNERLEFLGDSILSFLVSEYLYTQYPDISEGELTNLRSSVVKTSTLASIARNLDLGTFLLLSKGEEDGGGRDNPSILADTFEALLAVVFVDTGIENVRGILNKFLYILIPQIIKEKAYKDAKSVFQEIVQEEIRIPPVYKVLNEIGPDHAKKFTIGVFINNTLWGTGKGKSKQEAEMNAAVNAVEKWNKK
ncbi:ribonuclease III [Candidatus Gottesmanbacteria bacterium]|nr:ribonuclease III [Candidatus Gottesmanbacteria bacterium]